jgi:tRNA(Ile)-lysidine synthase
MVTASPQALLDNVFERALETILARVFISAPDGAARTSTSTSTSEGLAIGIAYSGGLDSSVLLDLAATYAQQRNIRLHAFHVHHGLSPNADNWTRHCEEQCLRLGVAFDCRRIVLDPGREGIEQAARKGRYAALGEMCRLHGVDLLLTAHHLDDQAETVFLQLLRGSGVAGLSGMEESNTAPDLLGDTRPFIGRPLLQVSRAMLEASRSARNISHIEDESNSDPRFARNALRGKAMPLIADAFPGFQQRIARSARHAASAQRLLNELAMQDFANCADGSDAGCLDLSRARVLSQDRIDNLFRYWFAEKGMRMPSTAWLTEMQEQLFNAAEDAQLKVTHPDGEIHRYRGKAFLTRRLDGVEDPEPIHFRWNGEPEIRFPSFHGVLHFAQQEQGAAEGQGKGIERNWLLEQQLVLRPRGPGDQLKPAFNRPRRALKYHYQALGIPPWYRPHLPVIGAAAGKLIFAAGIGPDRANAPPGEVIVSWKSDLFPE